MVRLNYFYWYEEEEEHLPDPFRPQRRCKCPRFLPLAMTLPSTIPVTEFPQEPYTEKPRFPARRQSLMSFIFFEMVLFQQRHLVCLVLIAAVLLVGQNLYLLDRAVVGSMVFSGSSFGTCFRSIPKLAYAGDLLSRTWGKVKWRGTHCARLSWTTTTPTWHSWLTILGRPIKMLPCFRLPNIVGMYRVSRELLQMCVWCFVQRRQLQRQRNNSEPDMKTPLYPGNKVVDLEEQQRSQQPAPVSPYCLW